MYSIGHIVFSSMPFMVTLFWCVILSMRIRGSHKDKKILLACLLTAGVLGFCNFSSFNHLYSLIPFTDTLYTFSVLSFFPLFYLYIVSLTGEVKVKHTVFLYPNLILALTVGVCYMMMGNDIRFFLDYHYGKETVFGNPAEQLAVIIHQSAKFLLLVEIAYIVPLGLKRIRDFTRKVEDFYSNTAHRNLNSLKRLLFALVTIALLFICSESLEHGAFINSPSVAMTLFTVYTVLMFLLGEAGVSQNFSIDDLKKECGDEVALPAEDYGDDMTGKQNLKNEIDALMTEKQLFLQPDLKISDIARILNTNRTYIYEALKSCTQNTADNFPDYVNHFRIAYCLQLMKSQKDSPVMKELLLKSGFTTEVTFYRAFKKIVGKTPKQYLNGR